MVRGQGVGPRCGLCFAVCLQGLSCAVREEASPGDTLPYAFHPGFCSATSVGSHKGGKWEKRTFFLFVCVVGCKPTNRGSELPLRASRAIQAVKQGELLGLLTGPGHRLTRDIPTPSDFRRATDRRGKVSILEKRNTPEVPLFKF